MNATALTEQQVRTFVRDVFEDDLHAKRILSLTNATIGAMNAASLAVCTIGRALALAAGLEPRHAIKQVDRLMSNQGIDVWRLFRQWVPYVLADRTEAVIAFDWTDFERDDHHTLTASLLTSHSRPTPLVWKTHPKSGPRGAQTAAEDELLGYLRELIPPDVAVTIIADRGFADTKLFDFLERLGFEYVIRIRESYYVTDSAGEARQARDWMGKGGQARMVRPAQVTALQKSVGCVVSVRRQGMKENWCLASSFTAATSSELIKLYGRRFTIEESFRDVKDIRFGMGLKHTRIGAPERRDRLLLVGALAIALLTLLGAAGEEIGLERSLKANTVKRRSHSLFNQGCFYYQWMLTMPAERLARLATAFAEKLANHAVFREAFGLI